MSQRIVRVAVIDSGVHASHPHVGGVAGGIGIDDSGNPYDDYVDRLGHGTAVTAAIREKAPAAEIHAIKVFDRELSATGRALVSACEHALAIDADIVNMSLGTQNADHELALTRAVERVLRDGAIVVAAGPQEGVRWLPGAIAGVWAVTLDWSIPREEWRASVDGERWVFRASGFPRPIPNVPPEHNLKGLSFAVANVSGLAAAMLAGDQTTERPAVALRRLLEMN